MDEDEKRRDLSRPVRIDYDLFPGLPVRRAAREAAIRSAVDEVKRALLLHRLSSSLTVQSSDEK